tara:strand:- start:694 stop:1545 length:852 start_codon:yes stop_codon:yes gene_type:complete
MSIKDITVIVASFKSEAIIENCLNSIDKNCNIIIVENSNNKNFKKEIEDKFINVKCLLAGSNLGYGKANNLGLAQVKTKYALILNPDAELYPKTIENFLKAANKNPDFAIIGPYIKENKEKIDSNLEDEKNLYLTKVKSVKGYAMFLNLSQFREVGFFDENIFIYLEEIDLCKRLLKRNKKIYSCSNILINHKGGKSHDISFNYEMELSRNWHWMWSTFYFNKKYRGFFISFLIVLPKLISSMLKILFYTIFYNRKKKEIYYHRYSGLINALNGKASWFRPKV